jgi:hypothetical protein
MENKKAERPAVLQSLLDEVDGFDESLFAPTREFEAKPGEKEIGEITGWPRRVFGLSRYYGREMDRLRVDSSYESESTESLGHAAEMQMKSEMLKAIFWFCVNAQFGTWSAPIGIRQNWKIVALPDRPDGDITSTLRRLLGS